MESLIATIESTGAFVAENATLAYTILFLGSYVEAIVGINFIIRGEIFFIAGSIFAGLGVLNFWLVCFALILGGILGDSTSYWIGKRYGLGLIKEGRFILNPKNFNKAKGFIEQHGAKSAFFARFLGPISWVTPFIVGTYRIPYRQFLMYNIPGVILGIGHLIVIGYFFASNYQEVIEIVRRYTLLAALGFAMLVGAYWYVWKHEPELVGRIAALWKQKR